MQVIRTRYVGPTNHKPARIVAQCQAGKVYLSWDYRIGDNENHAQACEALRSKLDWTTTKGYPPMIGARTDRGMVWVFASGIKTRD